MGESVDELVSQMEALQRKLVSTLQAETLSDDLEPPKEAFGWPAEKFLDYFENGGALPAPSSPQYMQAVSELEVVEPEPAPKPAPQPTPAIGKPLYPSRPALLLLGDSLTEMALHLEDSATAWGALRVSGPGWAALLTQDYAVGRGMDVINRGFSGYNTRWILANLPSALHPRTTSC